MDDLLADFLTETNESLTELDVALIRLERAPGDQETLALIFRLVHTIKGTCGFLGLPRLEAVAHAAENVLGRVRDGQIGATSDVVSAILAALDRIKAILEDLASTGTEAAGDDSALIAALDAIHSGQPLPATPPIAIEPEEGAAATAGDPSANDTAQGPQTIRVGVDVLENLMTLVSELVLTRNQLLQLARAHEAVAGDAGGFTVPLQRLSHITSDLQEGVMKTRMQPIGNAWQKLPRLVRDIARDLGKRIELVMHGAETELDRQVLELIRDPLTHMVRNAGDHGLETPEARKAAGKAEAGRITLNAYHEGGHIIIEVGDDGAGLSFDRIRAKAAAQGLGSEGELAALTDSHICAFIFHPGFSTASAVTAVSGRGVGMDVVKTNIEKIGGTIDVRTASGEGTTFVIKIPLTLAIISALIVEAGGERFAIPQISVVELVRARLEEDGTASQDAGMPLVEHINGTPLLRLRERLMPLVRLADLLGLSAPSHSASTRGAYVVIAQVGGTRFGIVVDRVFDTEEIVVKPVSPILRHITLFSGNTILGDGTVIMILDPNGIGRVTGIAVDRRASDRDPPSTAIGPADGAGSQPTAMLLFRAGTGAPKAVPLALVARLENLAHDRIEYSSDQPVTQYRGHLMPLVPLSGTMDTGSLHHAVLVFADAETSGGSERSVGLIVDEILDVVDATFSIGLASDNPGYLGTAVISGRATDVLDASYWLTRVAKDWFTASPAGAVKPHILVVEDSNFFRQLVVPSLTAVGYAVTGVSNAAEALRLREAGVLFDAIVSDVEMPQIDGLELVRRIRAEGPWRNLPVIALTSHSSSEQIAAGRQGGFTDYVTKFERDALLTSLRQCLAVSLAAPSLAAVAQAA
jgi:two-component system chemotaxis sensor kinase CheA